MKASRGRILKGELKKDKLFNFKIESGLKKDYQEFCLKNGYSIGKRLRCLIKYDMQNKIIL